VSTAAARISPLFNLHPSILIITCFSFLKGISAAKVLAKNGVKDLVILEASDRIGGRIRKENFGGVSIELGAGWIVGVGGKESNPVWELATEFGLRTCFADYTNVPYNIYDRRSAKSAISVLLRFLYYVPRSATQLVLLTVSVVVFHYLLISVMFCNYYYRISVVYMCN